MKPVHALFALLLAFPACSGPEGTGEKDCTDSKDNDGDGLIDCEDEGCFADATCVRMAKEAKEAELAAREAAEAAKREQEEKERKEIESPFFELGDILVQKKTNGENVDLSQAAAFCEKLTLGGFDDWRLPTESEAVSAAKSGKIENEAMVMWTSTMRSKKRGVIVGITSGAANELGVRYDGDCRARCVRDK